MNPVVVVHGGGASHIAKDRKEMVRQGVLRAATAGYSVLKAGGSAVDAVESAVAVLEDDPEFNAGACAAASPPRGPGVTPTFPNEPALWWDSIRVRDCIFLLLPVDQVALNFLKLFLPFFPFHLFTSVGGVFITSFCGGVGGRLHTINCVHFILFI